MFCCGPCPVSAIREGNLKVKYDAPFVFAEVNADIIYWMVQRNGQRKKVTDSNKVVQLFVHTVAEIHIFRSQEQAFCFPQCLILMFVIMPQITVDQSGVGMNISTKSVFGDHREDVTLHYKYPEGWLES